jgi:hypothetical protein
MGAQEIRELLLLVLGAAVLSSCTTAKMAIDPELKTDSHEYKITEKPGLTGDKLRFGPYLASEIDRDFMWGRGVSIGSYKNEKRSQKYTYDFKGERRWKASCKMGGKGQTIGAVGFGHESTLNCTFSSMGEKKSKFTFSLAGPSLVEAKGKFSAGAKNIRVAVIDKMQGSSLRLGSPIGYSFYSGNELIAGVNIINSEGPVLLNKKLSGDEKDRVSLVMVALLLFQEKSMG